MDLPAESDALPPAPAPQVDTANLGREMVKGTGWMIGARLSVQGIGFLSTLILARLLVPADFGLVALATTFSVALQAISEFSFDVVLIQDQQASREHYDTAWTLSVLRNAILAVCLALGAGAIARLFDDQRLVTVIYWLAASTVADGFQNIGIIDFRKDLAFHRDLIFSVLGKLAGFVVTIPLAFMWRNYWALVAGIVAGTLVRVVLSFLMHPYRPRFALSRWRDLMHFSKWLVLNNFLALLSSRSDTFIIGKFSGAQAVGFYSVAFEIANLTAANLLAPLRRAIFPGYSKLSNDPDALRKGFIDVFGLVWLIGTPLAVGIGAVADPMVRIMLGSQWLATIPLIQILSLYGFLGLITAGSSPVYLSLGLPRYILLTKLASVLVMLPLLVIGTSLAGSVGAAWAVTIAAFVEAAADFVLMLRLLHLPAGRLVGAGYRPVLASIAMALVVIAIQAFWPQPEDVWDLSTLLAVCVLGGAMVYCAMTLLLWAITGYSDGPERHVAVAIRNTMGRLAKKRSVA
jgi:O-antigen/teichoic acid export membrane protein